MLNQITLIGRLTNNPELNYLNSGTPVSNFTLAVERNNKPQNVDNENENNDVDFIPIVAWNRKAEVAAEYLKKGRLVAISGRLKLEKNETENHTYINPKVTAYNIQFLDSQNSSDRKNLKSQERGSNNINNSVPSSFNNETDNTNSNSVDDIQVPF